MAEPLSYVASVLSDVLNWRTINFKGVSSDVKLVGCQPFGGAWIQPEVSLDRILFWRTVDNNYFEIFEYSFQRNLKSSALRCGFGSYAVLPNLFVVELQYKKQILLMFATQNGVYKWILKHPLSNELDSTTSILNDITDDYLNDRPNFYRYNLQTYSQVTCLYTEEHSIYAFFNEMEVSILRFDKNELNNPVQFTFPKRQNSGLLNFFWSTKSNKNNSVQQDAIITSHKTFPYNNMLMTTVLYDNGQLRILTEELEHIIHEYNISVDLLKHYRESPNLAKSKMFLDYCQYELHDNNSVNLITRLLVAIDFNDSIHLFIYELYFNSSSTFTFTLFKSKVYRKEQSLNCLIPPSSSMNSLSFTNEFILLNFISNQSLPVLIMIQYDQTYFNIYSIPTPNISLPIDLSNSILSKQNSTADSMIEDTVLSIDDIEQRLSYPGTFSMDMLKEGLWITFNINLDEYEQQWTSLAQILKQLPPILQSLADEHCEEHRIPENERIQILRKFWQNLYDTLIDLRANALVPLGFRVFEEKDLVVVINKAAISLYSMAQFVPIEHTSITDRYRLDCLTKLEQLMKTYDDNTLLDIDEMLLNESNVIDQQRTNNHLLKIHQSLKQIITGDYLVDSIRILFDKSATIHNQSGLNILSQFSSKVGRRLLAQSFVKYCEQRIIYLQRLLKIIPLIFRANEDDIILSAEQTDMIQEKVLPYIQELLLIYKLLYWLSSCHCNQESTKDDRDLFIQNLFAKHTNRSRTGNQSLLEQIIVDDLQDVPSQPKRTRRSTTDEMDHDADNETSEIWFKNILMAVNSLFSLLWPNNDFILTYLAVKNQWTTLNRYCEKLDWYKDINAGRRFLHALSFYRSGNTQLATRYLALVMKELHSDELLRKVFCSQTKKSPELFYIERIREYLCYFGQSQNVSEFLHNALQGDSHSSDTRSLIITELFRTSLELKNYDDAFWCVQQIKDFLCQKNFILQYALSVCDDGDNGEFHRLRTLVQYQEDKLSHTDLELLANLEQTCVMTHPMKSSHVYGLYEVYKMLKYYLKNILLRLECLFSRLVAQITYHYGCYLQQTDGMNNLKEQRSLFQRAYEAMLQLEELTSLEKSLDNTDMLFIYPINNEYNSIAPMRDMNNNVRLIDINECRRKYYLVTALYTLRVNYKSHQLNTSQLSILMHPSEISGLLRKVNENKQAEQLLKAYHLPITSVSNY